MIDTNYVVKKPISVEKIDEDFEFDLTDMNYDNDGYNMDINHKVIRHTGLNLDFEVIPISEDNTSHDYFSFGSLKGSKDYIDHYKNNKLIKGKDKP